MCTHTSTRTSIGTLHRVRGLCARPFSITPPFRQPHSVFGGVPVSRLVKKKKIVFGILKTKIVFGPVSATDFISYKIIITMVTDLVTGTPNSGRPLVNCLV